MQEDLVSIIIPVYNAERFLEETIQTIEDQTYKNWEAIFVNDCSNDNSVKIIENKMKSNNKIKLISLKENSGAAVARNAGIDEAKGRYICFLDADDLWDKNKLELQIKFLKENDYSFSFTSYEFADVNGTPNGKKVIVPKKINYKQALKNTTISTITVMFDMTKLSKELIKMPDLKYVEDTATWWKILRNNYTAYGICEVYSYYRRIPNSNSSNKLRTQKYLWNLYRKEENLGFLYSLYCITMKNINAIIRRL